MATKDNGRWPGNLYVAGNLTMDSVDLPDNCVGDAQVDPGDIIGAVKLEHQHTGIAKTNHGTAIASHRQMIHVAYGAGSIVQFDGAVAVLPTGAGTVSVDLLKNGVSILSGGPMVIDSTNTAFTFDTPPGLTTPDYVANAIFEVVVTATAGGGTTGQGLVLRLIVREAPSP